jgi:hypothetical protein
LLLLPLGLRRIWVRYRRDALALVLTLGALAYPATLLARLTPFGADVATRTPEFLFFGLGFVVALAVAEMRIAGANAVARLVVAAGLVAVIFLGGIIIGLPGWGRLPGPYLVGADSRSVDPTGIAAAEWARVYLGPHNRVVADRVNNLLMGTYGQQRPVTAYVDRVQVRTLYFGTEVGTPQSRVIRDGDIRYLLSDRRLSRSRPLVGYYFDRGEFEDEEKRRPIDSRALRKFDGVPGVSRILDVDDIVLYDVRSLR